MYAFLKFVCTLDHEFVLGRSIHIKLHLPGEAGAKRAMKYDHLSFRRQLFCQCGYGLGFTQYHLSIVFPRDHEALDRGYANWVHSQSGSMFWASTDASRSST